MCNCAVNWCDKLCFLHLLKYNGLGILRRTTKLVEGSHRDIQAYRPLLLLRFLLFFKIQKVVTFVVFFAVFHTFSRTVLCFNSPIKSSLPANLITIHNLISVQSLSCRSHAHPLLPCNFPLQITNRCFKYASLHLWNQLPSLFRQPHSVHSPPGSPHPVHCDILITVTTFTLIICHSLCLSLKT